MNGLTRLICGAVLLAGLVPGLAAMTAGPGPSVGVLRVPRAPLLSDFLDMEPPADLAGYLTRVEGFVQQSPEDGQPASQRTEVYLGYDDEQFYAAFIAFDDQPDRMRANLGRRENVFGDEIVEIQLDTYHDQRRAFSFVANPYGVQWDAIWTEGQGFDSSWDTVWDSRGRLTDRGYVVLMSIPFKSLRFPSAVDQTWGVVLVRDIPRNNESSFWPRISNRIEGRLNQEATLTGISGVSPGRNLWLIPYGTARGFQLLDRDLPGFVQDDFDGDAGLDAKLVIRDALALDLTVNPDFSQVESDQPQVTVNQRFEVFFPEKRPFFLENADYFQAPLNLLFTRRIADPSGGARLTGKLGNYSIAGMVIDDEAPGKSAAPGDPAFGERATFSVFRLRRDVSQQSNVGVLFTDRRLGNGYNTVGGVDGRIKLNDHWDSRFQAVYSRTRDPAAAAAPDSSGGAFSAELNRSGRKLGGHFHYLDVAPGFRTDAGFVSRTDVRNVHASVNYTFRPEGRRLVAWGPSLFAERIWDHSGLRQDRAVRPSVFWEFRRQTRFSLGGATGRERLRPQDFPSLTVPRDYSVDSVYGSFSTQFVDSIGGGFGFSLAEGINFVPTAGQAPTAADRESADANVTLKLGDRTRIDTNFLFTRLIDPASDEAIFTNRILRLRVSWQLSPRLSLRTILQHVRTDSDPGLTRLQSTESYNGDLLATYLINPWTAVYLGYNGNYRNLLLIEDPAGNTLERTDGDFLNDARQIFVKVSYLFRL